MRADERRVRPVTASAGARIISSTSLRRSPRNVCSVRHSPIPWAGERPGPGSVLGGVGVGTHLQPPNRAGVVQRPGHRGDHAVGLLPALRVAHGRRRDQRDCPDVHVTGGTVHRDHGALLDDNAVTGGETPGLRVDGDVLRPAHAHLAHAPGYDRHVAGLAAPAGQHRLRGHHPGQVVGRRLLAESTTFSSAAARRTATAESNTAAPGEAGNAARRAQVHAVSAVLTDDAAKTPPGGSGYDDGRVRAAVRWTDADGKVHTGQAKIFPGSSAGSRPTVWTDGTGRVVSPPPSGTGATRNAGRERHGSSRRGNGQRLSPTRAQSHDTAKAQPRGRVSWAVGRINERRSGAR